MTQLHAGFLPQLITRNTAHAHPHQTRQNSPCKTEEGKAQPLTDSSIWKRKRTLFVALSLWRTTTCIELPLCQNIVFYSAVLLEVKWEIAFMLHWESKGRRNGKDWMPTLGWAFAVDLMWFVVEFSHESITNDSLPYEVNSAVWFSTKIILLRRMQLISRHLTCGTIKFSINANRRCLRSPSAFFCRKHISLSCGGQKKMDMRYN